MPATILDGRALGAAWRAEVAAGTAGLIAATGSAPGLAVVRVGDDPASAVYVRNKSLAAREAGMRAFDHALPTNLTQAALLDLVASLNADEAVDGILVQLPLPRAIDPAAVIEAIDPGKDVDGFHPLNAGRLAAGAASLVPCTPMGCLRLILAARPGGIAGAEAVVLGRSGIVGRPMAQLLLGADATVTIAHSRTNDLPAVCRRAEVLVAAVGRPGLVRGDWIRPGAVVIDVGINRVAVEGGRDRLTGDVAFEEARAIAGAITPVPGGVGPMTIAGLMANTLAAARARRGPAG